MLFYTTTVSYLITLKKAARMTDTLLCESGPVPEITWYISSKSGSGKQWI
jgi:hypothetical protein